MLLVPGDEMVPPLCAVVEVRLMIKPAVVIVGNAVVVGVVVLSFLQLPAKNINDNNNADNTVLRKEEDFMRNMIKGVKFISCSLRYYSSIPQYYDY